MAVSGGCGEEKAKLELAAEPTAELDPHDMGATAPGGFHDTGQ